MKFKKGEKAPEALLRRPPPDEEATHTDASPVTTESASRMFRQKKPVKAVKIVSKVKVSPPKISKDIISSPPESLEVKNPVKKIKQAVPASASAFASASAEAEAEAKAEAKELLETIKEDGSSELLDTLASMEPASASASADAEQGQEQEDLEKMLEGLEKKPEVSAFAEAEEAEEAEAAPLEKLIHEEQEKDPYTSEVPDVYVPQTRRGFSEFIKTTYKSFVLPEGPLMLSKDSKYYPYQMFVREYMRQESPYRGILVYHGLGSGKTCTSIAAAEALFLSAHKKIIVMTPFSLRKNFLGEISFCGFRQYQLKNFWVPLEKSNETILFATQVLGVSIGVLRKSTSIWIPDLSKSPDASNFASLEDSEKREIRDQIRSVVEWDPVKNPTGRFRFINYNGISAKKLQALACNTKERFFDDAVIVIDEIHNVIRNIHGGNIEAYLTKSEGMKVFKRKVPYEEVTVNRWNPTLCGSTERSALIDTDAPLEKEKLYTRGYLFYRLLVDAKNSKIIGLSGTPLINYPQELSILANVLHGYIPVIEGMIAQIGEGIIQKIEQNGFEHPYIDFVKATINQTEGGTKVVFTLLPHRIRKISHAEGVERIPDEEDYPTLEEILANIKEYYKDKGTPFKGELVSRAEPILPVDKETFKKHFIKDEGIREENKKVLLTRLTGLVSYYKGSNEELMPSIKSDTVVYVPFSLYAQKKYSEIRMKEIDLEKKQKKKNKKDVMEDEPAGSYKMTSRQGCNFIFPSEVARPTPINRKEAMQEAKEGATEEAVEVLAEPITEGEGVQEELLEEEQVEEIAEEAEQEDDDFMNEDEADAAMKEDAYWKEQGASASASAGQGQGQQITKPKTFKEAREKYLADCKAGRKPGEKYTDACIRAKKCLGRDVKERLLIGKENGLAVYSSKYEAILQKIAEAPGSSLVYSQFLTMEGIGIFRIAMDVNGYAPIEIVQDPEGGAKFSDATAKSLLKGPYRPGGDGEPRYITFSGEEDQTMRTLALNLFNGKFDTLPVSMRTILQNAGFGETENKKGELCRVFCITSAGAEGLSLKNVRAVHVMEPYWNDVRLKQVKGRAIRIGSHMDLPPEERNVSIYTYISCFSEEAQLAQGGDKRIDETIRNNDSVLRQDALKVGLPISPTANMYVYTSDEALYSLSQWKKKVIDGLESVLKSAAVDCELNEKQNKDGTFQCLPLKGKIGEFLYHPYLEDDILNAGKIAIRGPGAVAAKVQEATGQETKGPKPKVSTQKYKGKEYRMRETLSSDGTVTGFEMFAAEDTAMKTLLGTAGVKDGKPGPPVKLLS